MFESRSSKYLYLRSQILSHSWLTSLSRQYTIQIWRPKFTATNRQPPHHTTTSSPGSSRFPNKEAREHSRITWPIFAGLPTILDRIKWKCRPPLPPLPKSRMKPRKSQNAPFSHPWFVGRVWGCKFSIYFVLGWSPQRRFGANFGARRENKTKESLPLRLWNLNSPSNREEKSLRHVATIAKFLDDNKTKTPLKKWIRTVSKFIDLIQFHSICKILAKLSGVESERTVSE